MGLIFYALFFCGAPRGYRIMANSIGINTRLYPKHYIETKPWERRLFRTKRKTIPKFIYYCLWWLVFIGVIGFSLTLVLTVLCRGQIIKNADGIAICNAIFMWFFLVATVMLIANVVVFAVFDLVFTISEKKQQKKSKDKNSKFQ